MRTEVLWSSHAPSDYQESIYPTVFLYQIKPTKVILGNGRIVYSPIYPILCIRNRVLKPDVYLGNTHNMCKLLIRLGRINEYDVVNCKFETTDLPINLTVISQKINQAITLAYLALCIIWRYAVLATQLIDFSLLFRFISILGISDAL